MTSFKNQPLRPEHRVAIFWGGGLGDILVLRPLLLGLTRFLSVPPTVFTTAGHLPDLLSELSLNVRLCILPRQPNRAIQLLRSERQSYDLLYMSPYSNWRQRMLARTLRTGAIWCKRYADAAPFIGEQVLAAARELGLADPAGARLPYGGPWAPDEGALPDSAQGQYLVLHAGAKDRWKTTRWPDESWQQLIRLLCEHLPWRLLLVGVAAEGERLHSLVQGLPPMDRSRVSVETSLSLSVLAATVERSRGVICHNSGVLHLAAMLGKRTLALTGSSALYWRPPYTHVVNLTSGSCNLACNRYRCPVPFFQAKCIRELGVAQVLAAAAANFPA